MFAVFDQDSLTEAMRRVWDSIAPTAMFTAAGNIAQHGTENFLNAIDMIKWNITAQEAIQNSYGNSDFGYSGTSAITPSTTTVGSNNKPVIGGTLGTEITGWTDSQDQIRVPAGFTPIRGNNVLYADTLPPFDITLTFGNEYGQCAFQKIYDVDILNEASGVSVDTIVLERQMTYIARRISPMVKGVYSREEGGAIKGQPVVVS